MTGVDGGEGCLWAEVRCEAGRWLCHPGEIGGTPMRTTTFPMTSLFLLASTAEGPFQERSSSIPGTQFLHSRNAVPPFQPQAHSFRPFWCLHCCGRVFRAPTGWHGGRAILDLRFAICDCPESGQSEIRNPKSEIRNRAGEGVSRRSRRAGSGLSHTAGRGVSLLSPAVSSGEGRSGEGRWTF
jgi:hypothetical protein